MAQAADDGVGKILGILNHQDAHGTEPELSGCEVKGREGPGVTALLVDGDECEGRLGDFEAVVAVPAAAPCLDPDAQRCPPDPDDIGEEADFVADEDGGMEHHTVGGNGGAAASRPAGGGVAGGKIHLSHQPAAEDISGGVGVSRHGDCANDRFSDRDGIRLRHSRHSSLCRWRKRVSAEPVAHLSGI